MNGEAVCVLVGPNHSCHLHNVLNFGALLGKVDVWHGMNAAKP